MARGSPRIRASLDFVGTFPHQRDIYIAFGDVRAEEDGRKNAPNVSLYHSLSEVVIDPGDECSDRLLFAKRAETSSTFLQGAKQHQIKHLEDVSGVWAKVIILTCSSVTMAMTASPM
jgi:hypothetical protein